MFSEARGVEYEFWTHVGGYPPVQICICGSAISVVAPVCSLGTTVGPGIVWGSRGHPHDPVSTEIWNVGFAISCIFPCVFSRFHRWSCNHRLSPVGDRVGPDRVLDQSRVEQNSFFFLFFFNFRTPAQNAYASQRI